MKIAVFTKATTFHEGYGGLETQNKALCEKLAERGHKVTIFSPQKQRFYYLNFALMSTATAPRSSTHRGLISISSICSFSIASHESLTRASLTASSSAGAMLRKPFSLRPAQVFRSMDVASASFSGAKAKATSLSPSTSTPPEPNITSGPNCGSRAAQYPLFLEKRRRRRRLCCAA